MTAVAWAAAVLVSLSSGVAQGQEFTIVALPDTQFYSESYPKIAKAQTDWIVANRARLNIVYVAHLGDITNRGDEKPEQWANAALAFSLLENPAATGLSEGIPYGVVPGNHDHESGTRLFNAFLGVDHFAGRSYYGGYYGQSNNNHFDLFTASGLDFVVLYIDFNFDKPDYSPIDAWANVVLKSHANRRAIVVSHDLLAVDGSFDPRGRAIYNNLKENPNLILMLCGHNHGEARRFDLSEGRTVLSCLSDYQSLPEGGGGYLRIYRFSPSEGLVRVQTYSPWLGLYKTDGDSQFEFGCRMDAGLPAGLGFPQPDPSIVPGGIEPAKP